MVPPKQILIGTRACGPELIMPHVLRGPDGYRMWTGANNYHHASIGYSQSSDGQTWTTPVQVMDEAPRGSVDDGNLYTPRVLWANGLFHMIYEADRWSDGHYCWNLLYATSPDGLNWRRHGRVLTPGRSGQWDGYRVYRHCVLLDGDKLRLWYSGAEKDAGMNRIGYAEAPASVLFKAAGYQGQVKPSETKPTTQPVAALKCLKCGTNLPPGAKFCPKCGAKVEAHSVSPQKGQTGTAKGRIVFQSPLPGHAKQTAIYTIQPDGSELTMVTDKGGSPRWSRDCEWIVFEVREGNQCHPHLVRPDGADLRKLPMSPGFGPGLTPDGQRVMASTVPQIYEADLDGGNRRTLVSGMLDVYHPSMPGDGYLYFISDQGHYAQFDVYRKPVDGGQAQRLTNGRCHHDHSSVNPVHPSQLAVSGHVNGKDTGVYIVDMETGEYTCVVDEDGMHEYDPAWAPDGAHIVYTEKPHAERATWPTLHIINPDGTGKRSLNVKGDEMRWRVE